MTTQKVQQRRERRRLQGLRWLTCLYICSSIIHSYRYTWNYLCINFTFQKFTCMVTDINFYLCKWVKYGIKWLLHKNSIKVHIFTLSVYLGAWNYHRHRCSFCTVDLHEISHSEWRVFELHSDTVPWLCQILTQQVLDSKVSLFCFLAMFNL